MKNLFQEISSKPFIILNASIKSPRSLRVSSVVNPYRTVGWCAEVHERSAATRQRTPPQDSAVAFIKHYYNIAAAVPSVSSKPLLARHKSFVLSRVSLSRCVCRSISVNIRDEIAHNNDNICAGNDGIVDSVVITTIIMCSVSLPAEKRLRTKFRRKSI